MPRKQDSYRSILRWLRNRKAVMRVSKILIIFFGLLTLLYAGVHLYHWYNSTPHDDFSRFIIIFTNLFFGLASVLGVILAIWILGNINPERFTTTQELLRHCIDLFHDANINNCEVKLLILFPNPGQFDEFFDLKRDYYFIELKQKINACLANNNVSIEIVCLQGEPSNSNSTLRKFLEHFYHSEVGLASPQSVESRQGLDGYCGAVTGFMSECIKDKTDKGLTLKHIDDGWLSKMEAGEPMMVIGHAKQEAFLGTITFKGGKFDFAGLDFNADVEPIKVLYNSMRAKYTATPS